MNLHSFDELLAKNQKKLDLICFSCEGDFNKMYLPVFKKAAAWFCSLPLNNDRYEEVGGAFRCVVESCFFVTRMAKATIFTAQKTSDIRRDLEPQYRYAAFLAAVASWSDEPFRHFAIYSREHGRVFNPLTDTSLAQFQGKKCECDLQNKTEIQPIAQSRSVNYARHIIGDAMHDLDVEIQDELIRAINPVRQPPQNESVLHMVVRKGLQQAELLEMEDKKLQRITTDRSVVSANQMERFVEPVNQTTDESSQSNESNKKAEIDVSSIEIKPTKKIQQLNLPTVQEELPVLPPQVRDAIVALSEEIRNGHKDVTKTEWRELGLMVPKNFLTGLGKPITTLVSMLQKANVVVGTDGQSVIFAPIFGQYIVPKEMV